LDKGVTWKVGKVFFQDRMVYEFDMLPEAGHRMPAFVNLQQYYFEEYLVNRAQELSELIDLRWKNKVVAVESRPDRTYLTVRTPDGEYRVRCDYLLVADGANSGIRSMLGLESRGQVFTDSLFIVVVVILAISPNESCPRFDNPI